MTRKKTKKGGKRFKKVNISKEWDTFSPSIMRCQNKVKMSRKRYNCSKSGYENLLDIIKIPECDPIIVPNKKWKHKDLGFFFRANLIWDLSNC